jgi:hypothetical protein
MLRSRNTGGKLWCRSGLPWLKHPVIAKVGGGISQRGGAFMRKRSRLLPVAFSHLALIIGLIAAPSVAVHAQSSLPVFNLPPPPAGAKIPTIDEVKVRSWARPLSPSLVGKSRAELAVQAATQSTIPMWTGTDGTFSFQMVGTDPTQPKAASTNIDTQLIPVRFTFTSAGSPPVQTVFDPENNDPCSPNRTPALNMAQGSPVLKRISLTVGNPSFATAALGTGQFVDLFQRANFYTFVGAKTSLNPNYKVEMQPISLLNRMDSVHASIATSAMITGACNPVGMIEVNAWDAMVQTQIIPLLSKHGVKPKSLPIFLFSNVVMYDTIPANCCILGYHNAFIPSTSGALQTYVVVNYDTSGDTSTGVLTSPSVFPTALDSVAMSHEIAEWMDDPTTTNPTPPWGNIGQVVGCQSNLEVGDPLSGTMFTIAMPHFVYHVQDLAFKSWFYHDVPSTGALGWYSLGGTFTTPAAPCP